MNEHVPPAASEPPTADELRDDIEQARDKLADSVDALSSKLDVKAQGRRRLRDAKAQARGTARRAGEAASRTKQKAPAPIQKTVDGTGHLLRRAAGKLAPPARQCTQKIKAHRKQVAVATALAVLSVIVRRHRGDRDS